MHIIFKTTWLFVHVIVHNFMLNVCTIGARLVELPSENFYLHEESKKNGPVSLFRL